MQFLKTLKMAKCIELVGANLSRQTLDKGKRPSHSRLNDALACV